MHVSCIRTNSSNLYVVFYFGFCLCGGHQPGEHFRLRRISLLLSGVKGAGVSDFVHVPGPVLEECHVHLGVNRGGDAVVAPGGD